MQHPAHPNPDSTLPCLPANHMFPSLSLSLSQTHTGTALTQSIHFINSVYVNEKGG